MSQTAYSNDPARAADGLLYDAAGSPKKLDTYNNPAEDISYGRGVVKVVGDEDGVKLPSANGDTFIGIAIREGGSELDHYKAASPMSVARRARVWAKVDQTVTADDPVFVRYAGKAQVQTFVLSADAITGNTIAVTVDGVDLTQAFDTNHLTTMNALAAQIQAQPGVSTAVVGGSGNRTITVTGAVNGQDVELTDEGITGGVSQATITITETVAGISDSRKGQFRKDADSSTAKDVSANATFFLGASAGDYAAIDVNLP